MHSIKDIEFFTKRRLAITARRFKRIQKLRGVTRISGAPTSAGNITLVEGNRMIVDIYIDKNYNPVHKSVTPNINIKYWAVRKNKNKNSYILFPLKLDRDKDETIEIKRK